MTFDFPSHPIMIKKITPSKIILFIVYCPFYVTIVSISDIIQVDIRGNEIIMFKVWIKLFFYTVTLFFTACSSQPQNNAVIVQDNTSTNTVQKEIPKIDQIAPQQILYHDSAHIPLLKSGYGTFGIHEVATKSIHNSSYAGNLQTTLYYPKDINSSRPTLFFYAGAGVFDPNTYKGLFYFVASKGYNIIFITYSNYSLRPLPIATKEAINAFSTHIDKTKVGFLGHSMGAGVTFWMINQLSELGSEARILFPMASGYSAFNVTNMIPFDKTISLPSNTKMILQVYAKDYTTDIRIGIDLFVNNSISLKDKNFMLIYGDSNHSADHGSMAGGRDVNALMQRTIFRPLDALMDEAFNNNNQAKILMQEEINNDSYFHPYIGGRPQNDIDGSYIFPIDFYPFNCFEAKAGHYISKRKDYCDALGL